MLGNLFGIVTDVVKVVAAPIVIAAEVVRPVTKTIADVAEEVTESVKGIVK